MIREIDINFTTITDLLYKIIEDKKLYLKVKNIDLQSLNNKYILISDIFKELSLENYICICCKTDDKVSKKNFKQLYILLQDIKYKYTKAKTLLEEATTKENDIPSIIEMTNILLLSNIQYNYSEVICENLKNNIYEIKDYFWINNFINKIKKSNIINSYLKYKKLTSKDRFVYIKNNISYEDIDRVHYKLNCLLNNKYALTPPIYMNDFTNYFIKCNFSLDIKDSELLKSILDIKIETTKTVKIKWYHYFNRKKLTEFKHYNEKILTSQKTIRKTIFEQYKENIDSLKMYIKSFDFLKSVISDSYFNRIYDYLYDENEMYVYLKTISNNLYLFKELLKITHEVSIFSDKEKEVLDFCYDKYDTINKYKYKLYNLPTVLLVNYLENYKKSNIKKDNLDNIIFDLNKDISLLKSLLINNLDLISNSISINDISNIEDNNLNEVYLVDKFESDDYINFIHESISNKISTVEIEDYNYAIVKFIKETICNLGYKIVENYKYEQLNLEIAVVSSKDPNKIVYIFIECFQSYSYDTIRKLSYIKEKNIPIIYCWCDDFLINRNIEIIKLKTRLRSLFS